ncbi:ankyrin [Aaosphaeria arxii CBS 175.79]|uniref:Ankyrin n=1 Tax=Aaosphaeria arxii CBS 175.79 TaxID=1450172 RepID=A0A6A5XFI9_9PLEO|nr:ankyrin [Aaosphaeria arxii CBS 175.79]KAF2011616.1 ankyrin [Aaosphaeria arxii CBS 175.79]
MTHTHRVAFFDNEIIRLCSKTEIKKSVPWPHPYQLELAPASFRRRLLKAHIGDREHIKTLFAMEIHAVVDYIMKNSEEEERSSTYQGLLDKICEVLIHNRCVGWAGDEGHRLGPKEIRYTTLIQLVSFNLAFYLGYRTLVVKMLEQGDAGILRKEEREYYLRAIDISLQLKDPTRTVMLLNNGPSWERPYRWFFFASNFLDIAEWAEEENLHAIFLTLHYRVARHSYRLKEVIEVVEKFANQERWETACKVLNEFFPWPESSHAPQLVSLACRCGYDDLLQKIVDRPTQMDMQLYGKKGPLHEATLRGHVSTVRLLLENQALENDPWGWQMSLWRYAARGGRLDIMRLLQEFGTRKGVDILSVLVIAADTGHLEMAKYAVEHRFDRPAKAGAGRRKRAMVTQRIRYFALLRAIVRNRVDIIRWLVEELKISAEGSGYDCSASRPRFPILLAVDCGSEDAARVLLRLGSPPLLKEDLVTVTSDSERAKRDKCLEELRCDLSFGREVAWGISATREDVERCFWVATESRE